MLEQIVGRSDIITGDNLDLTIYRNMPFYQAATASTFGDDSKVQADDVVAILRNIVELDLFAPHFNLYSVIRVEADGMLNYSYLQDAALLIDTQSQDEVFYMRPVGQVATPNVQEHNGTWAREHAIGKLYFLS